MLEKDSSTHAWSIVAIMVVAGCGGLLDDSQLSQSNDPGGDSPASLARTPTADGGRPGPDGGSNPYGQGNVAPGQPGTSPVPKAIASCDPNKPFVIENLNITGRAPSVTRDETILVYENESAFYERKRTATTGFGPGTSFFPKYTSYSMDVVISPDGLGLDYVFLGLPEVEGTAGRTTRASTSTPFAIGDATPAVPDPAVPVWRVVNIGGSTYYTSGWDQSIHVVRNGIDSTVVADAFRWFAVSENELVLHYTTFGGSRSGEQPWVARRTSVNDAFGTPSSIDELVPGQYWSPIFVTWASNDDCVVYGWAYYYGGGGSTHQLGIFRAYRGQ